MRAKSNAAAAAAVALLLAVVTAAGCGGGDAAKPDRGGDGTEQAMAYLKGPTRQFIVPGGDNLVQEYGREATVSERMQASSVIQGWMRARAARDWPKVCRYLHRATVKSLLHVVAARSHAQHVEVRSCADALALWTDELPPRWFVDTMTGPIASLRVGQGHGYGQYHGRGGRDWIVAVRREGPRWKVSELEPKDRLK
jgi:hypothetical protein